jgi:thymidine phosphorylase
MDCEEIGRIVVDLGGGRKKTTDTIDFAVGLIFHKKLGAKVSAGDSIATAHLPDGLDVVAWEKRFQAAVQISPQRKPVPKLILETLS